VVFTGIVFGPLGPVQHLRYADARVRVDVAYRIAPDAKFGSGPAGVGPSIAAGSVTVVVGGVRRVVDLAALFPIREHHIGLSPDGTCGTGRPLARRGSYLVIEAILGEKGCAALVGLIDLHTGAVLERVALDHPSSHRFDARPEPLVGESMRVEGAQLLSVPANTYQPVGPPQATPWWVVAVRAIDSKGLVRELAYCTLEYCAAGGEAPSDVVPRAGSRITVGSLQHVIPFSGVTMVGERVVQLSRSDEARFEASTTPVPANLAQIARRNSWMMVVDEATQAEDFDAALAGLEHVVAIDRDGSGLDLTIVDGDRSALVHCRALIVRLRAGMVAKKDARVLFASGCVPLR